jgi:hypothetical protein
MDNIKLILIIGIVAFILYYGFLKSNSWFDQLIDFLKKSIIGKIILWTFGIVLVFLYVLIKKSV